MVAAPIRLDYLSAESFVGFDGALRKGQAYARFRGFFARQRPLETPPMNRNTKLFLNDLNTGDSRQAEFPGFGRPSPQSKK